MIGFVISSHSIGLKKPDLPQTREREQKKKKRRIKKLREEGNENAPRGSRKEGQLNFFSNRKPEKMLR